MSLFTLTQDEAYQLANETIGLFFEFRDKYGQDEETARVSAVQEVVDGLSVSDAELAE